MPKLLLLLMMISLAACASQSIQMYTPHEVNKESLRRAPGSYSAGTVSGSTRVESDQLVKSSLPCRLTGFTTPGRQPVSLYIENALKSELINAEKLAAPEGRSIDIVVDKLESDTSKTHDGKWTLQFTYKIGKISRQIQTMTEYPFASDSTLACANTADAFNEALRENFGKFFATLN